MSISICVVAQKQLAKDDFEKINLYNVLLKNRYSVPKGLLDELETILGMQVGPGPIAMSGVARIEIDLDGEGDVMSNDGLIIPIAKIPVNTVALRIYAE